MTVNRPTFLGIGAQKCGTTWLHKLLSHHPNVWTANPKEVDFFSNHYDRGYEWYGRFFEEGAARTARGETSPSYLYNPAVPARVKAYAPDLKLILILRDPIERAYSNHLHEVRKQHFTASLRFEDGMANNPTYVEQSRYAQHLKRWLAHFDREQILCLLLEDIQADGEGATRQVCEFLGVEPLADLDYLIGRKANESVAFRNEGLQDRLRAGGNLMRRMGMGSALEGMKQLGPVRTMLATNRRELRAEVPAMADETRMALAELLGADMEALARLMERDSLPWRAWDLAQGLAQIHAAA